MNISHKEPCAECHALLPDAVVYHPYAYCVLVKAGLDPEEVVRAAVRWYETQGWPEAKHDSDGHTQVSR